MKANILHQFDLLFVPEDKGYKYILSMIDVGSRKVALSKLKTKTPREVLQATKRIYNKKFSLPVRVSCDAGSEFKGVFKAWFESKNIPIKLSVPDRHHETIHVEILNRIVSKSCFILNI